MAYQRTSDAKIRGDSLDAFVENISKSYRNQLAIRNAQDELNFNTLVLEQNLPLDQQISYREDQLKRAESVGDKEEETRIKSEISSLKDRLEQKTFADEYLQKIIGYQAGITSIDDVITFLETQRAQTTDEAIRTTIDQELVKQRGAKFEQTKQLLTNQTDYALKDKTVPILDSQISKVQNAKNQALLSGNDTLASAYDLQLQSLTKAKTEATVEKTMKDFAVTSVTGYSTATQTLDAYNSQIASASGTGPVTIGDTTYASAKEFWTFKRDSFVADQSTAGFFSRLNAEVEQDVRIMQSKGQLTDSSLKSALKKFDKLSGRAELAGYEVAMTAARQDVAQTGVDFLADSITNKYAVDYDLNKAVGAINTLKTVGANVESAYTKLIQSGASIKQGQVSNILAAAQTALQNDPSLTPEMALQKALATGAGAVLSPSQLATQGEGEIATEFSKGAQAESFTQDPRLTVQPTPTPGETPTTPAAPTQPGTSYTGGSIVDYLASTGQASDFATRAKLAANAGIQNYTGSAAQNTQLLNHLRGTQSPVPAPASTPSGGTQRTQPAPTPQPQPKAQQPSQPSSPKGNVYQGASIVDYLASVGQDASFKARATLAAQKGITGYTGSAAQNTQLLRNLRGF